MNEVKMNIAGNSTLPSHKNINRHLFHFFLSALIVLVTSCSSSTSSGTEPDPEPEPEPQPEEVSEQQAIETIIQVIQDSGLTFPSLEESSKRKADGLSAMDYVQTGSTTEGLIELKLWIGPDGNIIPKPSWQESNKDFCKSQGRYMKNAVKQLTFTILSPTHEVQLNYIDIETGKIEESVIGEAGGDDANWLPNSMSDAWSQMQNKVSIGGAVGACGDKMEMQIQFSSEITTDLTTDSEEPIVYFEHIEATFPLEFDEDKSAYTGKGNLEWTAWEFNGRQGDNAPVGKSLEIVQLVTPSLDNPDYDEPALELELPGFEDGTPLINLSWPLIHNYKQNEEGDNYTYIITGWDVQSDDASVIMTKTFDRTENYTVDGDPVEITEYTTIEIVR